MGVHIKNYVSYIFGFGFGFSINLFTFIFERLNLSLILFIYIYFFLYIFVNILHNKIQISSTIRVETIKQAVQIFKNSEVFLAENIKINFDELEEIVINAGNALLDDCEFDSNDLVGCDDLASH